MTTYAIGDLHGCLKTFRRLLQAIDFDPSRDRLVFCGDLVNGGPDSLGVLRWIFEHQHRCTTVLGNHDLHMLAVAAGARAYRKKDTFRDILDAPDADQLLAWLRRQPMICRVGDFLVVHAGLLPCWGADTALRLGAEVERALQRDDHAVFLREMYGNKPDTWSPDLAPPARTRVIVNAMTRLRTLSPRGKLRFDYSGPLSGLPDGRTPWFRAHQPAWRGQPILFGHWSAIGVHREAGTIALDSGCVWGGTLSALRLDDRQLIEVPSELKSRFHSP